MHTTGTNPETKTAARFALRDVRRDAATHEAMAARRTTFDGAAARVQAEALAFRAEESRLLALYAALPE